MKLQTIKYLVIFVIFQLGLYLFISIYHSKIPFNQFNYQNNSYHFEPDSRISGKGFNLLSALGQFDAQWYLKIAQEGYPKISATGTKLTADALSYAFFPLYPFLLRLFRLLIPNLDLTAFLLTNLILFFAFYSLIIVITRLYDLKVGVKTAFLVMLYPLSIFYRSYYTEGLFLLLLIWFGFFLLRKRWIYAASTLGLLAVTRGNGLFLLPLFIYSLYQEWKGNGIRLQTALLCLLILIIPLSIWPIYCFVQTGDPFYFYHIRSAWLPASYPAVFLNLWKITHFYLLELHSFFSSKIDILAILMVLILLIRSKKSLEPKLWWISFLLWLGPLLTTDTISFSRFQIVSFPLFLFLAQSFRGLSYKLLLTVFIMGLLVLSIYFVNWYWVG